MSLISFTTQVPVRIYTMYVKSCGSDQMSRLQKSILLLDCLFHVRPSDFAVCSRSEMSLGDEPRNSGKPLLSATYEVILLITSF